MTVPRDDPRPTPDAGFSLVEAFVALFVICMIVAAIGQLLSLGAEVNRMSRDTTEVAALAGQKMEELRATAFAELAPGGSLTESVPGYADTVDLDTDGAPDYVRRWRIEAGDGSVLIRVAAMSTSATVGPGQRSTMASLLAER
jgi:type II secretory pathway pseudopilin PulG